MSRRRRVPENTSNYARWLARQIEEAYRGISLGPEAAVFVGMALNGYADRLDEKEASNLTFMVTAIDSGDRAEVLAAAANVSVAWAAFQAAIPTRTNARIIRIRARGYQGVRVLGQHTVPHSSERTT